MKIPPLLLGAALLFWGWQTKLLMFAIPMAIILEGARFVKFRWDFTQSDFRNITNVCSLILIGVVVYLFVTQGLAELLFFWLQWLPFIFFLLLAAQHYSISGAIDVSVLFFALRQQQRTIEQGQPFRINLSYPYMFICIIGAGAANVRTPGFYLGLCLLAALALWSIRSARYSPVVWVGVLLVAGVVGYIGQIQLHQLQLALEQNTTLMRWLGVTPGADADPYSSNTAIGDLGTVKLSNHVVFRVKSETGHRSPLLLREASYNSYHGSRWYAARSEFTPLNPEPDRTTWNLYAPSDSPRSEVPQTLIVSLYLREGEGVLKLPPNAFQLGQLLVGFMSMNQYGAVKVQEGPNLITYQVFSNQTSSLDSPPGEPDFAVPPEEMPAIGRVLEELQLKPTTATDEILQTMSAFFQDHFLYSLKLTDQDLQTKQTTPLANFLLNHRSGHCEYFATATVLLLRAAGIPARYAVGYSVDGLEKKDTWIMVRGRHAHAWTLVYFDGAWHDFDTTPFSWWQIEDESASRLERLSEFWAWCKFSFSAWQQREGFMNLSRYLVWLPVPLVLFLAWKLYAKKRIKREQNDQQPEAESNAYPGIDSEFYHIEQTLHAAGYQRYPWESLTHWIQRLETAPLPPSLPSLSPILVLHYRYRFDPNGLTPHEKATMHTFVQAWLEQYSTEQTQG